MAIRKSKGRKQAPPRILLYGVEKIGKSTFASQLPRAAHADPEDATGHLDIDERWFVDSWSDLFAMVEHLTSAKHDREWFVLDGIEKAEELLHRHVCEQHGQRSIESFGYGKGYQHALDHFREWWLAVERMRVQRGIGVCLIGHARVRTFRNPTGEDFDRYELPIHEKVSSFIRAQCDIIGFVNYESVLSPTSSGAKKVAYTGARTLHLQRDAAFDAGCRYPIPATLPFEAAALLDEYASGSLKRPTELVSEIDHLAKSLRADERKKVDAYVEKNKDNALALSQALDRLRSKLDTTSEEGAK